MSTESTLLSPGAEGYPVGLMDLEKPPPVYVRGSVPSGVCVAVVVVESKLAGGAQITAVLAAEMGRPVFAVPGDISREASEGTNHLIRDGAIPIFGAEDLIAELSLLTGTAAAGSAASSDGGLPESGVDIEDLPDLWNCSIKEALARLGRLEIAGKVVRSGDLVRPVTRYNA